jgi:2-aminoadipate transaminase
MPDYIDTTDLLARALREHVAFVPGRAAFVDGRGGSAMRLNFSGVGEHDIYEGIRRIGEVVREQVELYGTLTGLAPKGSPRREAPPERKPPLEPPGAAQAEAAQAAHAAQAPGASVLPLRRKRA